MTGKSLFGRIWLLCLIVFIDMVGFGVIIPSLPFWTKSFGADAFEISLVMTVFATCQFIFAFPLGWLSDRIGRKPVLALSMFGSVISFTLLGFAETLLMIFAARALGGMMGANISVAHAYVSDVTSGRERARAMGMLGASFGGGFVFGPAIGGAVAGADPSNPGQIAFFIGAVISAVGMIGSLIFLKEPENQQSMAKEKSFTARLQGFSVALSTPIMLVPIIVSGLAGLAMAGLEATYALWVHEARGWGARQTGWFFFYIGLVLVVVQGCFIGPVNRAMGERRMLYLGLTIITAGMALVAVSDTLLLVFLNGTLIAMGYGFIDPAVASLISRNSPADQQGAVMGVLQSVSSLARVIGPASAGLLFAEAGRNAPYIAGAIILAMTLAFALWRLSSLNAPTAETVKQDVR
ncbi:MAG: MFS transporter [Rhodospirillaceae bacterium]|nr:MFS transporter [Rhodospirillaceae bacterium]MCY4309841.1 MFS transporter [Rhodospirillaceae bacterium]